MAKRERGSLGKTPYDSLIFDVCGDITNSHTSLEDRDGAVGVAIVKTILDGHSIRNKDVARHLGLSQDDIFYAYKRLKENGLFRNDGHAIKNDKGLLSNDMHAWCTYAGYASGHTRKLV